MFVTNNFAKRKIRVKRPCVPRAEINIFIDANKFWVGKSQTVEVYIRVDIHARGPGGLSKDSLLVAKNSDCIQ